MNKSYVLGHMPCMDGFASMLVAWLALGDEAEYLGMSYGQPALELEPGADVYMLDFSLPRAQLLELKSRCRTLVVLDHHKTAQTELGDLDFAVFDLDKSGCVLTWEYFFPDQSVPELLKYVQDRDLWQFKLSESKLVNAGLKILPFDFEVWRGYLNHFGPQTLALKGEIVLQVQERAVKEMVSRWHWAYLGGQTVPAANATYWQSEVAHELLAGHPEFPFAATYMDVSADESGDLRHRKWSLRSRGDVDVGLIAKGYGGGGHVSAAGFEEEIISIVTSPELDGDS